MLPNQYISVETITKLKFLFKLFLINNSFLLYTRYEKFDFNYRSNVDFYGIDQLFNKKKSCNSSNNN